MPYWTRLHVTYQFGRGHPILLDVSLQISRQLQGHLTYFFPVGGFLIGWKATTKEVSSWFKVDVQKLKNQERKPATLPLMYQMHTGSAMAVQRHLQRNVSLITGSLKLSKMDDWTLWPEHRFGSNAIEHHHGKWHLPPSSDQPSPLTALLKLSMTQADTLTTHWTETFVMSTPAAIYEAITSHSSRSGLHLPWLRCRLCTWPRADAAFHPG